MNTAGLVDEITADLRDLATPERAAKEKAYLKSELAHLGARVPDVRRVTLTRARRVLPRERAATLRLAEELWGKRVHELRLAAVELLIDRADLLTPADPLLEDGEFFVRKALGWVLREHGKRAPGEVFAWLEPRRARASPLTLREASKYLGEARRLDR